jgi:hypothetical protein
VPRQKKSSVIVLLSVAAITGICGIVIIAVSLRSSGHSIQLPIQIVSEDKDKRRVEEWLRRNLNDGMWEEIAWYPTREISRERDRAMEPAQKYWDSVNTVFPPFVEPTDQQKAAHEARVQDARKKLEDLKGQERADWEKKMAERRPNLRLEISRATKELNELIDRPRREKEAHMKQQEQHQAEIERARKRLEHAKSIPTRRLCGIHIRTKNAVGANIVERMVFEFKDDSMRRCGDLDTINSWPYVTRGFEQ